MNSVSPEPKRLHAILSRISRQHVVVVGDVVADEFIYGQIDRVSREAPVLILKYTATEIVPGGAGNAAANAADLGARVTLLGLLGLDDAGARLLKALPKGVTSSSIVRSRGFVTPVKTRILAGGVHSAKQQVVRIDRAAGHVRPADASKVERTLAHAIKRADAVIISDYGSGLVTPTMWEKALASSGRAKRPPLVTVDSRYALSGFTGVTACTPNESEVEAQLGVRIDEDLDVLERAGRAMLSRLRCEAVLITRGSRGMALFEARAKTAHIPIVGSDQIADVTGAGDTVIATFTLARAAGASYLEAAWLANYAGGLVVMKRGTATVQRNELAASIGR